MFNKVVGIVHNRYIVKGGEDEVAKNEYKLLEAKNIKVHYLEFVNPGLGIKALIDFFCSFFNIISFFKTYRWLKKNKIEVMHVHNWFYKASPSIFWAARLLKVPVVLTLHNYRLLCPSGTLSLNGRPYLESLNDPFPLKAVRKKVYRNSGFQTFWVVFTTWIHTKSGTWKLPAAYIVLTRNSLDLFKKSKPVIDINKVFIKPNFTTPEEERRSPARLQNFLFIGRLSQEKGIETLLAAFKSSPYLLTIIGNGPLKEEVEVFAKNNANITFLGFQQKPVIFQQLNQCAALIFPSIWLETFGLTIIEAFASSTPVIASKQGSASLLIENEYNGLHFQPENAEDLKLKLEKWTNLPEREKEQFRINARKSYEDYYTADKNFDELISIYQKVTE